MKNLAELARKYSSDKYFWHSYIPKYEELFKGMEVKRLLEIGIGNEGLMKPFLPAGVEYVHGSSLKMWEEYFPEAKIFGCDINEGALFKKGRIRTTYCDQSDFASLFRMVHHFEGFEDAGTGWDVIIDDGSHQYEHQQITASTLMKCVGSLYVIEDVWPDSGKELAKEFGGEFWQGEKGRDDGLVIIRK